MLLINDYGTIWRVSKRGYQKFLQDFINAKRGETPYLGHPDYKARRVGATDFYTTDLSLTEAEFQLRTLQGKQDNA